MYPKEVLWIGAKGGLLAEKHYFAMREAIWLFSWLLLRQTGLNEIGEGIVNYGHPITKAEIYADTGYNEKRVERWVKRLRDTEYIRTEQRANEGLIFFILAAKSKTKSTRFAKGVATSVGCPALPATPSVVPPLINAGTQLEQNKMLRLDGGSPIPKGLSYYNKDAAAQIAAGMKSLSMKKQVPRQFNPKTSAMIQAEKEELRRKGYLQ